jgi:hypothetical protein
MMSLQIQFSTSTTFMSGMIRRLTHSPWSHVDFVLPEGLLGVSGVDPSIHDPGGVRLRPHNAWPYLTTPRVAEIVCTDEVAKAVIAAATSQTGKPFDNEAMWGMLDDQANEKLRDWRDPKQWFCSELVAWSLETGKVFPYPLAVLKNRVTPADVLLLINPFMRHGNIQDFLAPQAKMEK